MDWEHFQQVAVGRCSYALDAATGTAQVKPDVIYCPACKALHAPEEHIKARSSAEEHLPSKQMAAGSTPAAPTKLSEEQKLARATVLAQARTDAKESEISRGTPGRGVTASVPNPVKERILNREDEVATRQGGIPLNDSAEFSQPSHSFDRKSYQRDYMRDYRKAVKVNMTVIEWREKFGKEKPNE